MLIQTRPNYTPAHDALLLKHSTSITGEPNHRRSGRSQRPLNPPPPLAFDFQHVLSSLFNLKLLNKLCFGQKSSYKV